MKDIIFIVDEKNSDRKLRDLLRRDMQLSSNFVSKLKKTGGILVNNTPAHTNYIIRCGDEIIVNFPDEKSVNIPQTAFPLDIIYEDEYILAVNKPKDMPTHPSLGNYNNTLGNACMYYYREISFVYRPVNRLDRDTTGIVIIAKDARTSYLLSEQIKNGIFKKTYYAITDGIPKIRQRMINAPIDRESETIIKRCVKDTGKKAITEYKTLQTKGKLALLEILLHTGRTHQIRVHMAHIGTPLLYDYLYGTEVAGKTFFLHCGKICFQHPYNKKEIVLKCNFDFPYFNND